MPKISELFELDPDPSQYSTNEMKEYYEAVFDAIKGASTTQELYNSIFIFLIGWLNNPKRKSKSSDDEKSKLDEYYKGVPLDLSFANFKSNDLNPKFNFQFLEIHDVHRKDNAKINNIISFQLRADFRTDIEKQELVEKINFYNNNGFGKYKNVTPIDKTKIGTAGGPILSTVNGQLNTLDVELNTIVKYLVTVSNKKNSTTRIKALLNNNFGKSKQDLVKDILECAKKMCLGLNDTYEQYMFAGELGAPVISFFKPFYTSDTSFDQTFQLKDPSAIDTPNLNDFEKFFADVKKVYEERMASNTDADWDAVWKSIIAYPDDIIINTIQNYKDYFEPIQGVVNKEYSKIIVPVKILDSLVKSLVSGANELINEIPLKWVASAKLPLAVKFFACPIMNDLFILYDTSPVFRDMFDTLVIYNIGISEPIEEAPSYWGSYIQTLKGGGNIHRKTPQINPRPFIRVASYEETKRLQDSVSETKRTLGKSDEQNLLFYLFPESNSLYVEPPTPSIISPEAVTISDGSTNLKVDEVNFESMKITVTNQADNKSTTLSKFDEDKNKFSAVFTAALSTLKIAGIVEFKYIGDTRQFAHSIKQRSMWAGELYLAGFDDNTTKGRYISIYYAIDTTSNIKGVAKWEKYGAGSGKSRADIVSSTDYVWSFMGTDDNEMGLNIGYILGLTPERNLHQLRNQADCPPEIYYAHFVGDDSNDIEPDNTVDLDDVDDTIDLDDADDTIDLDDVDDVGDVDISDAVREERTYFDFYDNGSGITYLILAIKKDGLTQYYVEVQLPRLSQNLGNDIDLLFGFRYWRRADIDIVPTNDHSLALSRLQVFKEANGARYSPNDLTSEVENGYLLVNPPIVFTSILTNGEQLDLNLSKFNKSKNTLRKLKNKGNIVQKGARVEQAGVVMGKIRSFLIDELKDGFRGTNGATVFIKNIFNGNTLDNSTALSHWTHLKVTTNDKDNDEKETIKAQQEWCHLLATSLGGTDRMGNMASGSANCNSEQLSIENILGKQKGDKFKLKITDYLLWDHSLKDNYLSNDKLYLENAYKINRTQKSGGASTGIGRDKDNNVGVLKKGGDPENEDDYEFISNKGFPNAPLVAFINYKIYHTDRGLLMSYLFEGQSEFFDRKQNSIIENGMKFLFKNDLTEFNNWYKEGLQMLESND